jgi:membrane protease YdiL (CAAX protease family)
MPFLKRTGKALLGPLIYLFLTASLAALIAYPVFIFSHADNISFFRSVVSRGGQVLLLLGIFPLFRWLRLPFSTLGFSKDLAIQLVWGFVLGTLMLTAHVIGLVELGVRGFIWTKLQTVDFMPLFIKSSITGFSVGMLEETIFRGALLGALNPISGPFMAVMVCSLYYAALHFIGTLWSTDLSLVGLDTGFRIALDGFSHLIQAPPDSFIGLFVAGVFLGFIRYLFPQKLGICIGVHAGWVFVIQTGNNLTYYIPESKFSFLVGQHDTYVGVLSSVWLGFFIIGLILIVRSFRKRSILFL